MLHFHSPTTADESVDPTTAVLCDAEDVTAWTM